MEQNAAVALETYTQSAHVLGENISMSALDKAAHQPGVQHAIITVVGPMLVDNQVVVSKLQSAYCTGITITPRQVAP